MTFLACEQPCESLRRTDELRREAAFTLQAHNPNTMPRMVGNQRHVTDRSDPGNQQIIIFNQLPACAQLSTARSRPIEHGLIDYDDPQDQLEVFADGELPVYPDGQEDAFRSMKAHHVISRRVTYELGFSEMLPDAGMPLEMCG